MSYKEKVFFGSACALITPFKDGKIDYISFEKLIEFQIRNGTDALVVLGTTGEAPTISEEEREEIVSFAKKKIKDRVPLIVGTGTNSTQSTIRYSKNAHSLGANAILCVTPYYNKPTENGLVEHYKMVAKSVDLPIILYNVPSRTGVSLSLGALEKLRKIPNIVGVKEASGSVELFKNMCNLFGEDYSFYTGNDDLTYESLSAGGEGVVSVVANVLPEKMRTLCASYKSGDKATSKSLQAYLNEIIKELFIETNPIPVKKALSMLGMCENELRLPLYPSKREEEIKSILSKYGIL